MNIRQQHNTWAHHQTLENIVIPIFNTFFPSGVPADSAAVIIVVIVAVVDVIAVIAVVAVSVIVKTDVVAHGGSHRPAWIVGWAAGRDFRVAIENFI